jgi:hypothetical protein
VYYKIKALHKAGMKVILHCFQYGNKQPMPHLQQICYRVNYYPRKKIYFGFKPYVVGSRISKKLLKQLAADDYPILFEGLHTCYFLNHKSIAHKKRFVRTHNIEHDYYKYLQYSELNVLKRLYFKIESILLKQFEPILAVATGIWSLSESDTTYFKSINNNTRYLPVFSGNTTLQEANTNNEKFCLYHGKLSVAENAKAAIFLIEEVFSKNNLPLIIAGNNPPDTIKKMAAKYSNIQLKTDVSVQEMNQLIRQAHVHVLPTFQATGIKLKLVNALYSGKHVVVNQNMVTGNEFAKFCMVCNTPVEWLNAVDMAFNTSINVELLNQLNTFLQNVYNDNNNAQKIISWLQNS